MGKQLPCERFISKDERVFVLSNRQNIRVKRELIGHKWRSVETNRVYRDLYTIRRLVTDFEDKWSRRIVPARSTRPTVRTSLTGLGTEAQTVWLQDGWEEKRPDPKLPTPSHRLDVSNTANFAVPLTSPHETRQKLASAAESRRLLAEFHASDEHRADAESCIYCK